MSKVICDICGTTYPETATQCPICGCAKRSTAQTRADSHPGEESSYTYVRGGRFSKSNVRKRNQSGRDLNRQSAPAPAPAPRQRPHDDARPARRTRPEPQEDNSVEVNKGLIVVVVILLLAIIAVTAYICIKFILPGNGQGSTNRPGTVTTAPKDPTNIKPTEGIDCTGLTLSGYNIEFSEAGNGWLLNVEKEPANTTYPLVFTSSDESVATVSDTGYITAEGGGEAIITVTCGSARAECTVICNFGTITQPTEPTDPVDPDFVFEFNTRYVDAETGKHDVMLQKAGEVWRAYKTSMTVDPEDIVWTSDDPAVCTIENGIVTAVAPGKTEIHAQYDGKTYSCIVRCDWDEPTEPTDPAEPTEPTEPAEPTEPGEGGETAKATISKDDVTLHLSSDNSFTLRLKDAEGNTLEVEWVAEDPSLVTIEGNKITGIAVGTTNVSCTYEGVTYTCIVRIAE